MRTIPLPLAFYLFLVFSAVHGINLPFAAAAASTPPSALSASSSSTLSISSFITSVQAPETTPPPSPNDVTWALQEKWHLTTFWTCITIATQTHCGWREPVEPGGDEIAAAPRVANRKMAGLAAGAMVVAGLLL
ncbi:hypothetical protein OIDMADRAFT_24103 [Oidiodendron maius Zn]|uniref:Uncharacterized protein n=1 Tax=Oidiodendron maius (strain Zn) TaxID=913774 RepID=A0A0C3HRS8_OIDMZ|nr:hypothetical protein OIDMADRAFT_24103 [Oidiodendron maius Zn]